MSAPSSTTQVAGDVESLQRPTTTTAARALNGVERAMASGSGRER